MMRKNFQSNTLKGEPIECLSVKDQTDQNRQIFYPGGNYKGTARADILT